MASSSMEPMETKSDSVSGSVAASGSSGAPSAAPGPPPSSTPTGPGDEPHAPAAEPSVLKRTHVSKGEHVLLHTNGGFWYFTQALSSRTTSLGRKYSFPSEVLIGAPYGAVFELKGEHAVRVKDNKLMPDLDFDLGEGVDNRNIKRVNNDALQEDDLLELRAKGISGAELIGEIVESSSTFSAKTAFSQQKYLKKKAIQYMPRFRVLKATAMSICKALFVREPGRICFMRSDTLAQILTYANLKAGSNPLVIEDTGGLIVGAVAERLGGQGRLMNGYFGRFPNLGFLTRFSLDVDSIGLSRHLISFPIKRFLHLGENPIAEPEPGWVDPSGPRPVRQPSSGGDTKSGNGASERKTDTARSESPGKAVSTKASESARASADTPDQHTKSDAVKSAESAAAGTPPDAARQAAIEKGRLRTSYRRLAKKALKPNEDAVRAWLRQGVDSAIIVTHYDPLDLVYRALLVLKPGCPLVVYCESLEPLARCSYMLRKRGMACRLQLSEAWTRFHQVLPGRTHPTMSMNNASGYILWGYATLHSYLLARPDAPSPDLPPIPTQAMLDGDVMYDGFASAPSVGPEVEGAPSTGTGTTDSAAVAASTTDTACEITREESAPKRARR